MDHSPSIDLPPPTPQHQVDDEPTTAKQLRVALRKIEHLELENQLLSDQNAHQTIQIQRLVEALRGAENKHRAGSSSSSSSSADGGGEGGGGSRPPSFSDLTLNDPEPEDPNSPSIAMYHACRNGRTTEILALLDSGSNVNAQWEGGKETPLSVALRGGHLDSANVLLERGADTSNLDNLGGDLL
jgi:hypothetical protein